MESTDEKKAVASVKRSPSDFLKQVIGKPVIVQLHSGVTYKGILACLDGFMNIAMEQTEEYVDGQLKARYGDCFLRGNNENLINTGDHVLFEYKILSSNGDVIVSHEKLKQLTHIIINDDIEKVMNLKDLCPTATRMFMFENSNDLINLPFIHQQDELIKSSGPINMLITIYSVTTPDNYEIFHALKTQNISYAIDIIQRHHGINAYDEYGQTSLMVATIKKYLPVIAELLNAREPKVDINAAKSSGYTVLFYAVQHAPVGILHALLKKGANPNVKVTQSGGQGNTPLHFAVLLEKSDHIEILLEYGADIDVVNEYGQKPIDMLASETTPSNKIYINHLFKEAIKKRGKSDL